LEAPQNPSGNFATYRLRYATRRIGIVHPQRAVNIGA